MKLVILTVIAFLPLTAISWGIYLGTRFGLALLGLPLVDQVALVDIAVITMIVAGALTNNSP
jgi:hypothetical protein